MPKSKKYEVEVLIDKLTNSILNTISGDSFATEVLPIQRNDLKNVTKKNEWNFTWQSESRLKDRQVFKLVIKSSPDIIQGLMSISDLGDHYYLHLIESAPFNLGKKKLYEGVAGNLFAYSCKLSWDNGNQGIVSFTAKTRLISHYEDSLGAIHIGGQKMIIYPQEALILIKKYFLNK
jgi:hypothetical protein